MFLSGPGSISFNQFPLQFLAIPFIQYQFFFSILIFQIPISSMIIQIPALIPHNKS